MNRNLLIFAWEYPGVSTFSGVALSRRIGQVAEGFAERGWQVTVLHRNHVNEQIPSIFEGVKVSHRITRFPIDSRSLLPTSTLSNRYAWFRKLATLYYLIFKGDRSSKWAHEAFSFLCKSAIIKPDLIIGFYTPKGPLLAASMASKYYGVPWFADLQDPFSDTVIASLGRLNELWLKRILASAKAVFHVSPEWASETEAWIHKEVFTIRHAVPIVTVSAYEKKQANEFTVLYAGSLFTPFQSPLILLKALQQLNSRFEGIEFKLILASNKDVLDTFVSIAENNHIDTSIIEWLGWLSPEQLKNSYLHADCLALIPWDNNNKIVVPSKLFEYMAYPKPILIAGIDSGGISSLLKEWEHADVICDTQEKIEIALAKLYQLKDTSGLLQKEVCKNVLYENTLAEAYEAKFNLLH